MERDLCENKNKMTLEMPVPHRLGEIVLGHLRGRKENVCKDIY